MKKFQVQVRYRIAMYKVFAIEAETAEAALQGVKDQRSADISSFYDGFEEDDERGSRDDFQIVG